IDFLLENSKKEGIIATATGLQYQIIVEGVGEHPKERDKVKVMYSGRTIDGNVFDRSKKPAVFPLDRVIKGFSEGIMLLKPGAVAKLYIPSDLAYGKNSPVASIPPNSVLIFEVELIEIVKD
ncbi:MAG: FKBP-type peptidyl-prolyl cis-trans isomerase, partial [Succinivibrio sp.]